MPAPVLAAPLVIPFAEALGLSVAILGMDKVSDKVNQFIKDNPEESMKIFQMIMPAQGIANALKNKSSEEVEEKISLEDLEGMSDEEAQDLSKEDKAELMKQAGKSGSKDKRQTMIDISEKLGLSGEGKDKQDIEYEIDERYDEGGVEEVSKPKFDYTKFFRKRKADGGSIGIEVLFEPKRKDFNIGGQAQKTNTTPYDARASVQDYAAAMQKVGAGTDAQKLQAIGEYGLNQMQNSPSYFKAVGQGINQHMINNQMLRDAFDAKRITEDQYKLMGGYDVARLSPKIGLGNIKIGGTPGDVGIASAIYNAIKAGGIGAEKLGIKETDPFNQYGDIGFFGSIAKNYQGAKGLSESDKTLYESIISGKTQSDIDRFRSGLYAANQVDKATGDRLYGGNIENLFEQYKKNPSTFFYAGDDTQNMYDRFNKYYADGGRVGLFMGGDPLTGQALAIYNSMNAYGFSDQEIANALQAQGLYTPGSTPVVEEPVTNTVQNITNQGGGDGPPGPTPTGTKTYGKTFTGMTMPDGTPIGSSDVVEGVGIIDGLKNAATDLYGLYQKFSPIGIFSNFMKQRAEKQQEIQNNAIEKARKEREMQQAIKDAEAAQAALDNAVRTGRRPGSGSGPTTEDDGGGSAGTGGYSYDAGGREGFGYGLKDGGLVTMFKEKR